MTTEYKHSFLEYNNGEIDELHRWDRVEFKETIQDGKPTDKKIVVRKNFYHTSKKDKAKIWHKTVNKETMLCKICDKKVIPSKQQYTHAKSDFWGEGKDYYIVHVFCVLKKCGLLIQKWIMTMVFQMFAAFVLNIAFIIWLVNSKYWCY